MGLGLAVNVQADDYSPETLQGFAQKKEVIAAMKAFKTSFPAFRQENGLTDLKKLKTSVQSYYQNDFAKAYAKKNGKPAPNLDSIFTPLDDDSIALQYYYISSNSHALGKKDDLSRAKDKSKWSSFHEKYHPLFRSHLKEYGLYDVFLVDTESGDIIYSVFKELDFTTSLLDGPYAKTNFGEAFRSAREASDSEQIEISFRAPYYPSYESDAVFVAAPVFDGKQQIGVLMVQIPFK